MSLGQFERQNQEYTHSSWDEYMKYAHRNYQKGGFPKQQQSYYQHKFYYYDPRTGRFTEREVKMEDIEEYLRRQAKKRYEAQQRYEEYQRYFHDFFGARRDFKSPFHTPLFTNILRFGHVVLISFMFFAFLGFLKQLFPSSRESDRERLRNALKEKRKNPTPKERN